MNKKLTLANGLKYELSSTVDKKNCIIKIREMYCNAINTQILDLKDKVIQEQLAKLGYVKLEEYLRENIK